MRCGKGNENYSKWNIFHYSCTVISLGTYFTQASICYAFAGEHNRFFTLSARLGSDGAAIRKHNGSARRVGKRGVAIDATCMWSLLLS